MKVEVNKLITLTVKEVAEDDALWGFNDMKNSSHDTFILSNEGLFFVNDIKVNNNTIAPVLSEQDIMRKAKKDGDFLYMRFKKVFITQRRALLTIESRPTGYWSEMGGFATMEFLKENGRWTGKVIESAIY